MFSPFDSPIGNSLVRMMAETKVFEQQGQQQGQGGGVFHAYFPRWRRQRRGEL